MLALEIDYCRNVMYNNIIIIYFISLINIFSFSQGQNTQILPDVLKKVDKLIIKYTGEEFYYNNYTIDTVRYSPGSPECQGCAEYMKYPYYSIIWVFKIKDKPFINERVGFPVDTCGNLVQKRRGHQPEYYPEGFPDCVNHPEKCQFPIDSLKAISIAKSYGFEEGLKEWEISFSWCSGDILDYVWGISNTLEILNDGRHKGKVITIDANNGKILNESLVFTFYNYKK